MNTWRKYKWALLGSMFLVSLVCGVWGLVEAGKRFLDASYLTMQMITLNAGFEDGEKALTVELARFALPIIVGYTALAAIWTLARQHLATVWLRLFVDDHYVICGLGDRGMALARDLMAGEPGQPQGRRVVAIEIEPNNSNKRAFLELGGIVVEGDAREASVLKDAKVDSASNLVLLTNTDVTNLKILAQARLSRECALRAGPAKDQKLHVHIASRENQALFDVNGTFFPPGQPKGLDVGLFNVHENAAIALFQQHVLGANVDTTSPDATPVRLLIAGFGHMGEAVLVEALQLGHFCNGVPISITVLTGDSATQQQRFLHRYREVVHHLGDKGLQLWNLCFVETLDKVGPLGGYSDIIACEDDEDTALAAVNAMWDRWRCEERQRPTRFFLYAPSGCDIANQGVVAFGGFDHACSANLVIARNSEAMAKAKSDMYAQTTVANKAPALLAGAGVTPQWDDVFLRYDAQTDPPVPQDKKLAWRNMSLLKRSSNLAELRHFGIKLGALGLKAVADATSDVDVHGAQANYPYLEEFPAIARAARDLLCQAMRVTRLSESEMLARIHRIAAAEHNRWNAFHVLNNFRLGPKNETQRTHDCLLRWDDLATQKPHDLKWDYQNVYQILGILRLIGCGVAPIDTKGVAA